MKTEVKMLIAGGLSLLAGLGIIEYNTIQDRKLEEKKAENERIYFSKLSSDQVEALEREKLAVKRAEIDLKNTQAELKKTVTDFKNQIQSEIEDKAMKEIHDDMRETFDKWSSKFETRLENKIDNMVSRIDNLSDKYGGVKESGSSGTSINVVNAPSEK